jgi:hypothetical protein
MTGKQQPDGRRARPDSESIPGRLLAVTTAAMPASRRDWGKALSAELAHVPSRRDQRRLVLAGVRVALLQPGLADYRRAAIRSASLAAIVYVPLGLVLYLSNVVFASRQDGAVGDLALDGYVILAFMVAGATARRASARPGTAFVAGVAAGLVLAVLGMATFAVLDNAFLSIVSHQQDKIIGFRQSGLTSMRAYINADLEATTPGVAIVAAVGGALFACIGAAVAPQAANVWSRLRGGARIK